MAHNMFLWCSFLSWLSCLCWVFFLLLFVCLLLNYVIQVVVTSENLNDVFHRIMSFKLWSRPKTWITFFYRIMLFKLWSRPAPVARLLDFIFVNLIVLYFTLYVYFDFIVFHCWFALWYCILCCMPFFLFDCIVLLCSYVIVYFILYSYFICLCYVIF